VDGVCLAEGTGLDQEVDVRRRFLGNDCVSDVSTAFFGCGGGVMSADCDELL